MIADIVDAGLDLAVGHGGVVLAGEPAASAVAAVHAALVGDQEQHAVRIAVGEAGHRGVGILVERIELIFGRLVKLRCGGDALTADGIIGIVRVDQGEIIGGDRHAESAEALSYALFLFGGELDVFFKVVQRLDAVLHLPAPVIPKLVGNVCEKTVLSALIHSSHCLRKVLPFAKAPFILDFSTGAGGTGAAVFIRNRRRNQPALRAG